MKNIAKIEVCEIDGTSYEGLNRPIEFEHNALEEINVIAPWGYLPPHNLRIIVSVGCWVYAFATHCIEICLDGASVIHTLVYKKPENSNKF